MSEETEYVHVTLKMPDDEEYKIIVLPKVFKSGRTGFFAQIPPMPYNDEIYTGQIQVWKKTTQNKEQQE